MRTIEEIQKDIEKVEAYMLVIEQDLCDHNEELNKLYTELSATEEYTE